MLGNCGRSSTNEQKGNTLWWPKLAPLKLAKQLLPADHEQNKAAAKRRLHTFAQRGPDSNETYPRTSPEIVNGLAIIRGPSTSGHACLRYCFSESQLSCLAICLFWNHTFIPATPFQFPRPDFGPVCTVAQIVPIAVGE